MCSTLSWVRSLVVSDCLIEVGEGVKISLSNLFNYFSVSGDFSKTKISHKKWYFDHNSGGGALCSGQLGTTQKYHFFFTPPLSGISCYVSVCRRRHKQSMILFRDSGTDPLGDSDKNDNQQVHS